MSSQDDDFITVYLPNENATDRLAQQLAALISAGISNSCDPKHPTKKGGRIHLKGDLGAGKTSFARAFLRAIGVTGRIKSPTYTLLESYKVSSLYLYHFDFYRFSDSNEWQDAGFRENLLEDAIVLIEWAEKAGTSLPPPDLELSLNYAASGRDAKIQAFTEKGQSWIKQLQQMDIQALVK
ncbi:tRNA (adenosine(37)-N6)-threonylcarbamoyltransferase complex ATPase subunit type 1 TsaE [Advenella sp. RU8]|uniref:tRNA (adenosine(37)-N6)-threonylcarbamoyltransferase complex ATPase subunit type 1 TsaE n=1 Tax=Advenella sp. RU8 TaxID=3399575 RepID=UPI003AB05033